MLKRSRGWLALIVITYLVIAILYAAQVPAWQAPDEPAHYNYVHELVATGRLPVLGMGDYDEIYLEQLTSQRFPPELSVAALRYEGHQPPLYYFLLGVPFRLSDGNLLVLRLLSVLLGAIFIVLTYEIARIVLPRRPLIGLGSAALVAFLPMHVAMAASVNNDALSEVLLAAILFLSLRYVKLVLLGPRKPSPLDALALGLLVGAALITKVSAYVAIPIALAAPLIGWYEEKRREVNGVWRYMLHAILILVLALLIALPWFARNASVYGNLDILARRQHDAVVVGQLRTAELLAQAGLFAVLERFATWSFDSFWGVFGWMGVWMDARIYSVLLAWALAVAVGCAMLLARNIGGSKGTDRATQSIDSLQLTNSRSDDFTLRRFRRYALALLGLSVVLTLGIYVSYNLIFVQPQGRYLFPALPAIALAVTLGWREVLRPYSARWAGLALLIASLLAAGWGWLHGGVNKWSVAILSGSALLAWLWSAVVPRLRAPTRRSLAILAFALPFVALAGLSLYALYAAILPQLA